MLPHANNLWSFDPLRRLIRCALSLSLAIMPCALHASITVTVSGPAGSASQLLPDEGGSFDVNLPLNRNAVNPIRVTASDRSGNQKSVELAITQLSLEQIVVSQVTAERLSTEEVVRLVADGTIQLDDPANYNVSEFSIVLTIAGQQVPIQVPIAFPKAEEDPVGYENIRLPPSGDGSGGRPPPPPPPEIIVFLQEFTPSDAGESVPPIPGVIIIEGRIKSLKEFFNVRLLLMNTAGIFTLSDVLAEVEFPDGGLSHVLPADGIAAFGDILPGTPEQPGALEKEFIIRGDAIGVRKVRVNFGGTVKGPGIPADEPIPFNGSAETTVEVKGPPQFRVQVQHPAAVTSGVPYELTVEVLNAGELPALYASLELDVSADARLANCTVNEVTGAADCQYVDRPVVQNLGHIQPGERVLTTWSVLPTRSGPISSCMGVSDQNISLQVVVGALGCVAGHYPPDSGAPAGIPNVNVVPFNNAQGISIDSPVVAFFSEQMNHASIRTGTNGTFNVVDAAQSIVPGQLRVETNLSGRTLAIWQVNDGVLNRLRPGEAYTVYLSQGIRDMDGNALFNEWVSTFKTTTMGVDDTEPPQLTISIEPPVNPMYVLPGEVVRVNAYAVDQGSGIARVELRMKDLNGTNLLYTLVDQKSIFAGDQPPFLFALDSANFALGHTIQLLVTAYDGMGNSRNSTLVLIVAPSAAPPTIALPSDPAIPVLQGVSVMLKPMALTGGVRAVRYHLDGAAEPYKTVTLPPWQASLSTLALAYGAHEIRAVAVDGLGQTGEDTYAFNLVTNPSLPIVSFPGSVDGEVYIAGASFAVRPRVEDEVGVRSVHVYLASPVTNLIATNAESLVIDTALLDLGAHHVIVVATNELGKANDPAHPDSVLEFQVVPPPVGMPPDPPLVTSITAPTGGYATVTGTSSNHARIDIENLDLGGVASVYANASGLFSAGFGASGGNRLRLVAYDLAHSADPSAPTNVIVPTPPALLGIEVRPAAFTLTAVGQHRDLNVWGIFDTGQTNDITAQAVFSSSAPGVAAINSAGRVVAIARGNAIITAITGGRTNMAAVFADIDELTNFTVHISKTVLIFPGDTATISVTGQYSSGTSGPLNAGISYGAGNPEVAIVSGSGIVAAVGEGSTTISVGAGGLPPQSVSVSVAFGLNPPPATTILSPVSGTQVERGQFVTFNVQAVDLTGGVVRTEFRTSGAMAISNSASYSVRPADTRGFSFSIPVDAPIGGVITAQAWSVDIGGLVSSTVSVTLAVADLTAPQVSILSPTNGTPYNGFQTVVVEVAASDLVGVSQVGCETEDAFAFSGVSNLVPPTLSANVPFAFILPPNAPSSNLVVRAFAHDLAGNVRTSAAITLIMTDSDITPPETIVTSAVAGSSNSIVALNYMVTEGMNDLDHVGLYYRRNGIGTFNRWTDPDGTNLLGRYYPASGSNGVVVFDATKMGGDGVYEFYSVGADARGNRELPPALADRSFTVTPFFVWTTVTSGTTIIAGDPAFANRNLLLSNAYVVVEGPQSFRNVDLLGTSRLVHAATTMTNEPEFQLSVWSLHVGANAAIAVDGFGYLGGARGGNDSSGQGPGNTNAVFPRAGASHGGVGSVFDGPGGNPVYGNFVAPADLGAGGSSDGGGQPGGNGGGRIRISAINIAADGVLSANGNPSAGNRSGSGAGGSIYLSVRTLSGNGWVRANGGNGEMGAGGGRVAVHYVDISTKNPSLLQANGGQGSYGTGGNGTVYLKGYGETDGTIVIDGQGISGPFSGLPIPPGVSLDNLILRNTARVVVDDPIVVNQSLQVLTGSILTHSQGQTNGLHITAHDVFVDGSSSIDVSDKGYAGGLRAGNAEIFGRTLHGQSGATTRSAGSYGGYGAVYNNETLPALPYGTMYEPVYLGSGGSSDGGNQLGGNGGGRISIVSGNSITVQGVIRADGQASQGNRSGSGSGGSIWLQTAVIQGAGEITARGGAGEMAGGGGRIRVDYRFLGGGTNNLNATRNISARGGRGSYGHGSAGSVLLKRDDQLAGDMIVDDGSDGSLAANWSPWVPLGPGIAQAVSSNELILDGAVRVLPGGLVGMMLQPDLSNSALFKIIANTASSVVVHVSGASNLNAVAAGGSIYRATYAFDNITLRRGAWGVTADRIIVTDTLRVEDFSVLTHFNSLTNYEPGLDIEAGAVIVNSNAAISVSTRGYPGGRRNGNLANRGITIGRALGANTRSGASHGGIGSVFEGSGSNPVYGDSTQPSALGSGGSSDGGAEVGGNGGGRVRIVAGSMHVDGRIAADGMNSAGNRSGAGSGGSVWLSVGTITGSGLISALGGVGEMAAGGGRIATYFHSSTMAQGQFRATGGQGAYGYGGHGTVYLKQSGQAFGNLVLQGASWIAPDDTTPYPAGLTFDNVIIDEQARVVADVPIRAGSNVVIKNSSRVSHTVSLEAGLRIEARGVELEAGSVLDVSAKGYRGGRRDGNLNHFGFSVGETTGALVRSGASHGGRGSVFDGAGSNPVYGNTISPTNLGAGGSSDGGGNPGGNGGGRIAITALQAVVHGTIRADGQNSTGNRSGAGAGGSILMHVTTLSGTGSVSAIGGAGEMAAGGGRIAVYCTTLGMAQGQFRATGGQGSFGHGGHGSVYWKRSNQAHGDLILQGTTWVAPEDTTPYPFGLVFDNVIIDEQARVVADAPIRASNVVVKNSSRVSHTLNTEAGLCVDAYTITVEGGSTLDVSGKGYRGGQRDGNNNHYGFTIGETTGARTRSGASHGGRGSVFDGAGSNPTYGNPLAPTNLGSGGSSDGGGQPGGHGGGRITITAQQVVVHGSLRADGMNSAGNRSGAGSGGSIWLTAASVTGSGLISAVGGAGEMAAGGGRIAVHYDTMGMTQSQFRAIGGQGAYGQGGVGSLVLQSLQAALPDYVVDGLGVTHPGDSTELPTGVVFRTLSLVNGARVMAFNALVISQAMTLANNSVLTQPVESETGLVIRAGFLNVDATSAIDASGRGYRGGRRDGNPYYYGITLDGGVGAQTRSGGSYGGSGSVYDGPGSNPIYGSATNPVYLGSGGSSDGGGQLGGNGGGRIDIWINGAVVIDGSLIADGQAGQGARAGSGSGGSILLKAETLDGNGIVRARGGAGEMGGGGGRVAVFVNTLTMNTNRCTAGGGAGAYGAGSAGSVFFGSLPGPFGLLGLPSVSSLTPVLLDTQVNGQQIVVVWNADGDGVYAVQFSPDLMPSAWTTLQYIANPVWTGTLPAEAGKGFWRIIQE